MLANPLFANSAILSGFLRFIVKTALAGESSSLKEYTVGVNVLSKKSGYDPQSDAAVRIHAGRLRRTLDEYYENHGTKDEILISVPKGTYVPRFEINKPLKSEEGERDVILQHRPTLAVLPFYTQEDSLKSLVDGLCDQISTELGAFQELAVVSYYTSRSLYEREVDLKEIGLLLDANYMLTGSIQPSDGTTRIRVHLIRTDNLIQVWAASYDCNLAALDTFKIQDDVVRRVVNQLAGSFGIIFREASRISPGKSILDIKVYDAIFWFYHMVTNQTDAVFQKALRSMQDAVKLDPTYAMGWAVLSERYMAGVFNGFDCHVENPLEEAIRCGRASLALDQRCYQAYQSLGVAYLFLHRKADSLKIVERWSCLKSNAAGIGGGMGFCLICSGEFERGYDLLQDSIQLNPYYPWWFNGDLSFYHFERREYEDVVYWADKMHVNCERWELIMKIAAAEELGILDESAHLLKLLKRCAPQVIESPEQHLGAFIQDDSLVKRMVKTMRDCISRNPDSEMQ